MGEIRNLRRKPGNAMDSASNGLTGIPKSIHWPATPADVEAASEYNVQDGSYELDRIAIEHFLDTLARIALSITTREQRADIAKDEL